MTDNKKRVEITPDQEAKILEAIHEHIRAGLYILPVKHGVKVPRTEHGFKDSTNHLDTFMRSYHPGDNIGVETGKKNNLYLLDFDVKKDPNGKPVFKDGKPIQLGFKGFCKKFHIKDSSDPRLKTRMARTQSGGLHIYYKLPEGKEPLGRAIGILPHVDLLGEGGFAVVPPISSFPSWNFLNVARTGAFHPSLYHPFLVADAVRISIVSSSEYPRLAMAPARYIVIELPSPVFTLKIWAIVSRSKLLLTLSGWNVGPV